MASEQEAKPQPYHSFLDDEDLAVMAMVDEEDAQAASSEPGEGERSQRTRDGEDARRLAVAATPEPSPSSSPGPGSLGAEADAAQVKSALNELVDYADTSYTEAAEKVWMEGRAALDRLLAGKAAV